MMRAGTIFLGILLLLSQASCLYRKPWVDDAFSAVTPSNLPALPTGPGLRVLVIGDFGTGGSGQAEVSRAIAATHGAEPPHLVLTVGDNIYPAGVQSVDDPLWQTVIEDVYSGPFWEDLQIFPSLGNHDAMGSSSAQIEYSGRSSRWNMTGEYFTFQHALPAGEMVRFLALDTNPLDKERESGRSQLEWIDSILSGPPDRWVVAYGHHPMATGGWHSPSEAVRDSLSPRFQGRVPLFLAGHNHSTELLSVSDGFFQGVCGGGAGRDNAYRVDELPETLSAFSNGGWCFLHFWRDVLAIELYNRAGTLRFRHLIRHAEGG